MPKENEVQIAGRVQYIEPNSLFVNSPGNKVQNGIPQPYEDYSFSVNLRVINGNRYDCGMTSDGEDIAKNVLEYSSDRGTISFMDGTSVEGRQGYLTTNFTDISMNNPETNTKECLGIESISVRYDSWYYPTVDIKFIDVRGASLMQPAEYQYYNNGGPSPGKNAPSTNSKFFKAFFSFPYPLFKLSIKGFYGKEVTYDLSLTKCNVSFNSSTGNFEVATSFIGYMYGMYGDLPFSFVYLAPYIDLYGKNTWDEKRATGDFCYLKTKKDKNNPIGRGMAMYTFPELRRAVENAGEQVDKEIASSEEGIKRDELKKLTKQLDEFVIPRFPSLTDNFGWWSWSKVDDGETRPGFFYVEADNSKNVNRAIFEDFYNFSDSLNEYNVIATTSKYHVGDTVTPKPIFENFYNNAKEVKKNKKTASTSNEVTAKTVSTELSDSEIETLLSDVVVSLVFHKDTSDKDKPVLIFDDSESSFGSLDKSSYTELIDELKTKFENKDTRSPMHPSQEKEKWTIRAFAIPDIDYKGAIIEKYNELSGKLNKMTKALDEKRDIDIEKVIGFEPTMQNIYNMVFAHVDTFMSTFYNTLDRIRKSIQSNTDDSRKAEKLCSDGVETDVNEETLRGNSDNQGKLPPFTMFYKEQTQKDSKDKRVEIIWPGSLNGGENLEEVKLVEAIINATAMNRKNMEVVTPEDNITPREGSLAPTNYFDIVRDNGNPYLDILNDKALSNPDTLKWILEVFMLRSYYSFLNGSYVAPADGSEKDGASSSVSNFTEKAKLIAELEVGNLERAFQMANLAPKDEFITQLHTISENGSDFIGKYIGGNEPWFSENGVASTLKYRMLDIGQSYKLLPVGNFNKTTIAKIKAEKKMGKESGNFLLIEPDGTKKNGLSCRLYDSGKFLENKLSKYGSGDFMNAARLFPNYKKVPTGIKSVAFHDKTFAADSLVNIDKLYNRIGSEALFKDIPQLPSFRKTEAGITSIFMDPLYYAQEDNEILGVKANEARAYLFLMGIPFGGNKDFFVPERVENGDYPTLMLLREGAIYWRNSFIRTHGDEEAPIVEFDDPIKYEYVVNGVVVNTLQDIEENDPNFGRRKVLEFYNTVPTNVSVARTNVLIDFFLKFANGVSTQNPNAVTAETPVKITIPSPSLDFQTIERNLALWEDGISTVKTILSPESCIKAFSASNETVNSFANSELLKGVYKIGPNDALGKCNGRIRTDVYIKNPYTDSELSENVKTFLEAFKKFYIGFNTIIDYSCVDDPHDLYLVPRTAMNDAMTEFIKGIKQSNRVSKEQIKNAKSTSSAGKPDDSFVKPEVFRDDDLKLAIYIALKGMYDKWLCSRRRECWIFSCDPEKMFNNGIESDFRRFFYIDEFYHNIGMTVRPNLSDFIEMACKLGAFTEKSDEENLASVSIVKILSIAAQKGGCALLTLPTGLGLAKTYADTHAQNSIADVFKAFTYNEAVRGGGVETSFIVLYRSQKSSVLENSDSSGKNAYKSDGFDIANTWGQIVPQTMFSDGDEDSYVVPAFGVTFAKQNQSYFKDVKLSMEDHQITEFAARNTVMISYNNNKAPRNTNILGQDLYSVFSNYSYSCTVTMMGDAQITPLMYFQLNNIAMWKGAYLIINVHHEISSRGMETVFVGQRQARPSLPFKGDKVVLEAEEGAEQTAYSAEKDKRSAIPGENLDSSERRLDKINVDDVESIVLTLNRQTMTGENWINGTLSATVYYKDAPKETIENIALTKEATYGTTGRIENFNPRDNQGVFSIPSGRYSKILVENPFGTEYRDVNDKFYSFTEGKHITISDSRLGFKVCEIITGETVDSKLSTNGLGDISFGGTSPVMLYGYDGKNKKMLLDHSEIHAVYKELFNLVKRMNEARKPLTLLITENERLEDTIIIDE